jgi:hypothetical protein
MGDIPLCFMGNIDLREHRQTQMKLYIKTIFFTSVAVKFHIKGKICNKTNLSSFLYFYVKPSFVVKLAIPVQAYYRHFRFPVA